MSNATVYIQKKNEAIWDSIPNKSDFLNNVLYDLSVQLKEKQKNGGTNEKQAKPVEEKPTR